MNIKNKKAEQFTLAETMKIILGVASIFLLLILASAMYGIFSKKSEIEQARASLDEIIRVGNIENLNSVLVESPNGWFIASFWEGDELPKDCKNDKCICICKMSDSEILLQDLLKTRKSLCDAFGYCVNPDKSFDIVNAYQSIKLSNLPLKLSFFHEKDSVSLGVPEEINSYSNQEQYFNSLLKRKILISVEDINKEVTFKEALLIYGEKKQESILNSMQKDLDLFSKEQNILSVFYLHDGFGNNKIFIKNLPILANTPNFAGPRITKWVTIEEENTKVNIGYSFNKIIS